MGKITVWECTTTHKLYRTEEAYRKHLRKLAASRRKDRAIERKYKQFAAALEEMRSLTNFDNITEWIEENSVLLAQRALFLRPFGHHCEAEKCRITCVKFFRMRWSRMVSNSHSAPIGQPTNWHRDSELPIGYPGWEGSIQFDLSGWNSFASDLFKGTGINTESGGAGGGSHSYECKLFADDFGGMAVWDTIAKSA